MVRISKGSFIGDAFITSIGTAVAQAVPMLFYPLLSRLFIPSEFGLLATIMSITGVLSVIFTGKYETAVLIANNKRNAANLVLLSLVIASALLLFFLMVVILLSDNIALLFNEPMLKYWIYAPPFLAFFYCIYLCYNEWCVRNKYFVNLSINKITNTSVSSFSKAIIGWSKICSYGLVIGEILGRATSATMCVVHALRKDKDTFLRGFSIKRMILLSKRYKECPMYVMPAQLINTIGGELPVFLFASCFNSTEVGYYAMALLVLSVPSSVISIAIRDVFRKRANEEYRRDGNCKSTYSKTLLYMSLLSLIVFSIIFIIAPWLFSFVLGEQWRMAGVFARIMIPMVAISFVTEIGSSLFIIAEKMKVLMWWQIAYFLLSALGLSVGVFIFKDIKASLFFLMIGRSIAHTMSFILSYSFAKGKNNNNAI